MLPPDFQFTPILHLNDLLIERAELMFGPEWRKAATLIEGVENRIGVENSTLQWTMRESHLAMISECSGKTSDPSPGVPAYVVFYEAGGVSLSAHFNHGLAQNPSPEIPAKTEYYPSGAVKRKSFFDAGRRNNPEPYHPAEVEYYESGSVSSIANFLGGCLVITPGGIPAYVKYGEDGVVHHGLTPTIGHLTAAQANAMIAKARINECEKLLGCEVVLAKSSCVVAYAPRKNQPRTL